MTSSPTTIDEYLNYQIEAEKKYEIYGVNNMIEKVAASVNYLISPLRGEFQ